MSERTCFQALCKILDRGILILEIGAVLMVQPTQLLENLRVMVVFSDYTLVRFLGTYVLA